MPYTELCCRSGGSNLNAGSRSGSSTEPGTAADFTYASGNWVNASGVFTVASGNPSTDGVVAGDFASVYANGSTVTGFVGRVTAVSATTITVSSTVIAGAKPTDGTGTRTLKVGGAWAGPAGAVTFPFGFIIGTLVGTSGFPARVNFKNDINPYLPTASLAHSLAGPVVFQGYTSSYGDKGRATFDAGATAIIVINSTGAQIGFADIIVTNNGASGTNIGLVCSGARSFALRCVAYNIRSSGMTGASNAFIECEAYQCNKSFSAGQGGFGAFGNFTNCIAHRNTGSVNCAGFITPNTMTGCIAADNSGSGVQFNSATQATIRNCDFYNNAVSGIAVGTGGLGIVVVNSNFIKNTGYGINCSTTGIVFSLRNGFGAGTMANTLGTINPSTTAVTEVDSLTYPANVTPWADPTNGDYRITLVQAKNVGYSEFPESDTSYSALANTIAYPDIGAAQAQSMAVQPTYGIGV